MTEQDTVKRWRMIKALILYVLKSQTASLNTQNLKETTCQHQEMVSQASRMVISGVCAQLDGIRQRRLARLRVSCWMLHTRKLSNTSTDKRLKAMTTRMAIE